MIFAVNKPKGISSNGLLKKIRKLANTKKVGHGGTLDPLAQGVLVVGIGRVSTKKLTDAIKGSKEYIAEIQFGATSTTDDEEGDRVTIEVKKIPDLAQIKQALTNFKGEIFQKPPIYSALKVKGKPAYKYARAGKEIDLSARPVLIKNIKIVSYDWPVLELKVSTGSGVYIRSLARDLGENLQVGGYLKNLIRTRVGDFYLEDSVLEEDLENFLNQNCKPK